MMNVVLKLRLEKLKNLIIYLIILPTTKAVITTATPIHTPENSGMEV